MSEAEVWGWALLRLLGAVAVLAVFFTVIGHAVADCDTQPVTQRCVHEPLPQPDGTTLCRSYERRRCVGRECGPWEVAK